MDGLADGIINNYMACRANCDVTQGAVNNPWVARFYVLPSTGHGLTGRRFVVDGNGNETKDGRHVSNRST